MRTFRRVCVFCGSSDEVAPHFLEAATRLGQLLADRGIGVVYGGGRVGLMGAVAEAALGAGGEVIGVIPEKLMALEVGHTGLTELFVVDSMHARKMMMAQLSDAFVALPGGWGTLEELFEVTTWAQLGYHNKPVGLLNHEGYYDGLLQFMARAVEEGFVRDRHRDLVLTAADPEALLARLVAFEAPPPVRWMPRP